jgi:hypothetical protein
MDGEPAKVIKAAEALVDDSTEVLPLEALAGVPEVLLLEALIKLHGWWVLEPGTLRRPWQRPRVHHFMNPEGL